MTYEIIPKEEYKITNWSGGTTTELFIYPEGSNLKDRNFDFRISSASFTGTESTFSDFSGYKRYILPLTGYLSLFHEGNNEVKLTPYEINEFNGSWSTTAQNSHDCTDFNFIVREDKKSECRILEIDEEYTQRENTVLCLFSAGDFSIEINEQPSDSVEISINGGDLLIIDGEFPVNIYIKPVNHPVILCGYK